MTPSADRVQCPYCLARVPVKGDGTMRAHDRGRPRRMKRCPGAGKTKEQANQAKVAGGIEIKAVDVLDVRPEDIF